MIGVGAEDPSVQGGGPDDQPVGGLLDVATEALAARLVEQAMADALERRLGD